MKTKSAQRSAKAELSREVVVERALALGDAEGLEAVTIRRLAQEFGVTPMALYWHVQNKDELLAAMGDTFFTGLAASVDGSGAWTERLRRVMLALVGALRRHPGSASLAEQRVLACDDGRELAEETLALLRAEGFSIVAATDIARTAMQTAVMLVIGQAGAEIGVPVEERDAVRAAKNAALAALPRDRFPNLVAHADAFTDCADVEGYYDFGVELFVAGVQQLGRKVAAESSA